MTDETVGSFLARRVDKRIADNLVSAVFHGIYAGDIWQLSAKSLLSLAWELEGRYGNALGGFFRMQNEDPRPEQLTLVHPLDLENTRAMNEEIDLELDFARNLQETSMFTLRNGLQQLIRALQDAVEARGNVEIKTESPVQSFKPLSKDGQLGIEIVSGVRSIPLVIKTPIQTTNTTNSPKAQQQPQASTPPSQPSATTTSLPPSPS